MTDEHLRRSIRAMSSLGYGSALILVIAGLSLLAALVSIERSFLRYGLGFVMLALAVLVTLLAYGLRSFRPWARIGAIVMSCAGLLAVPFGTFLCGPFLYVLLKSKHLFTPLPAPRIVSADDSHIDRLAA